MQRTAIYRWSATLAAFGLLVSACTSNDDEGTEDSDQAGERTTLEVPWSEFVMDGSLFGQGAARTLSGPIGATLMPLMITDDQNKQFSPILESWEISQDAQTVTLALKPDIEWSDGTPVTSTDITMTLTNMLAQGSTQLGDIAGLAEFLEGETTSISGISAPDDLIVVIELDEPNAAWLSNLGTTTWISVLPEHILGDVPHDKLSEHDYFENFPVTNGPYKFVEYMPGQHVELERNENWSLGEAGFERVFFKVIADTQARAAQLETGEIQFMPQLEAVDAERIGALDGIDVQSTPGVAPFTLGLMYQEPLLDRRVRQAMAYAIDRDGICQAVLRSHCEVPVTNIRQIGPEWAIPTDDLIDYRYDPKRARDLLNEAGWDPDTELTFLLQRELGDEAARAVEIARGNMADVGINWTVTNMEVGTLLERAIDEPESLNGWAVSGANFTIDPNAMAPYASCDTHVPNGPNLIRYCNKELDELWEAGRLESSPDQRAEIYQEAFRILNKEVPEIYLYVADEIVAHDSRLKGVKPNGFNGTPYWNIGEWYWEG